MPDVSIYVAVIAAGGTIVAGAVPLVMTVLRDGRRARRDREEQLAQGRRQACVQLLRTVGELRSRVANYHEYRGGDLATRMAEIRQATADARVEAVNVRLMVPSGLGKCAAQLAEAAARLTAETEHSTDWKLGALIRAPDFAELDRCADAFTADVMATAEKDWRE